MKETIIVVITLAGLFCGMKLEGRFYPEKNADAEAKVSSDNTEKK